MLKDGWIIGSAGRDGSLEQLEGIDMIWIWDVASRWKTLRSDSHVQVDGMDNGTAGRRMTTQNIAASSDWISRWLGDSARR